MMRLKYFVLLAAFCCCARNAVVAQALRFSDTTNLWTVFNAHYDPEPYYSWLTARYLSDTVVGGVVYRRLSGGYSGGGPAEPLGIREDAAAGRIYCRFLSQRYRNFNTDAAEHLFFDYNLQVGDTLRVDYTNYHSVHYVKAVGTVMLGGGVYRTWDMWPVPVAINSGNKPYTFIEGLGNTVMPTFSVSNWFFEDYMRLLCFTSGSWRPFCVPAVGGFFDNDSSCRYRPLSIPGLSGPDVPQLLPNPGGRDAMLSLPAGFATGAIVIRDVAGRVIAQMPCTGNSPFPIGQYVHTAGLYYYSLYSDATRERFTGRFVLQQYW